MSDFGVPNTKAERNRYNISPEKFVSVWQTSRSADEAVARLSRYCGLPVRKKTVLARAAFYRREGVNLKRMPHVVKELAK